MQSKLIQQNKSKSLNYMPYANLIYVWDVFFLSTILCIRSDLDSCMYVRD